MLRKLLLVLFVLAAAILVFGAFELWSMSHDETGRVLAALVEQTPTPTPAATLPLNPLPRRLPFPALQFLPSILLGTVKSVEGSTLQVETRGGDIQVAVAAMTQLIIVGTPKGKMDNIAVGDKVFVWGARVSKDVVNARGIIAAPANYTRDNLVLGRVESVQPNALTLATPNATKPLTVTGETQVFGPGLHPTRAAQLQPGSIVLAIGLPQGKEQFESQVILTLSGLRGPGVILRARLLTLLGRRLTLGRFLLGNVFGTVSAVENGEITFQPEPPARTFATGAESKVIVVGKPNAGASDIQPGDKVIVVGVRPRQGSAKPQPRLVVAAPPHYSRENVALGRVQTTGADQFVLKTRVGELTVTLNDQTQLYTRTLESLSSADVQPGMVVLVIGEKDADGTMLAQLVLAGP